MNTTNSRIIYLWQQFSARQATRAELDELMELLSSGSHDEESRQYLQQLLADTPAGEEDPARWEPILQSILHPVRTLEPHVGASGAFVEASGASTGSGEPCAATGAARGRPSGAPYRLSMRLEPSGTRSHLACPSPR